MVHNIICLYYESMTILYSYILSIYNYFHDHNCSKKQLREANVGYEWLWKFYLSVSICFGLNYETLPENPTQETILE